MRRNGIGIGIAAALALLVVVAVPGGVARAKLASR